MSPSYQIVLNTSLGKAVTALSNPKPRLLPPLVADTAPEIRLQAVTGDATQRLVDLDDFDITLAIDEQNPKPENGQWTLTDGSTSTAVISALATAQEVENTLSASTVFPNGVTVKGTHGNWVIENNQAGELPEIGGSFAGTTATSKLAIIQLDAGSSSTKAAYRVQIIQEPAFKLAPADWQKITPAATSSISQETASLYHLTIDPDATAGYFTLTIHGVAISGIPYNVSAYDLENLLKSRLRHDLNVERHIEGGYLIHLGDTLIITDPAITLDDSSLYLAPYWKAGEEIKSEALSELLEGAGYADCSLEIRLTEKSSGSESAYILPVTIQQPVSRDTPDDSPVTPGSAIRESISLFSPYTGLWHEVTAALDGGGQPVLQVGAAGATAGENPLLIPHTSDSAKYSLHIGSGLGVAVSYHGTGSGGSTPTLKLAVDAAQHVTVAATGSISSLSLNLTLATS